MSEKQVFTNVDEFMRATWGARAEQKDDRYRAEYDKVAARLQKLHDAVRSAIDQLVLVISRELKTHGCSMGMPARMLWPLIEQHLWLGILAEPGLTLTVDRKGLVTDQIIGTLTTSQFVRAWQALSRWHTRLDSGPITDGILNSFQFHLDTPLEGSEDALCGPVNRLEVIAGDEAVFAWAVKYEKEELVQIMARLLGREMVFPTLQVRHREERDRLARDIEAYWVRSCTLRLRIQAVEEAGKRGAGVISLDGTSLTPCENLDDAFWISLGDRNRLEESDRNLFRMLRRLIELGVDDTTPNINLIRHILQHLGIALS